jgi:CheY-like chemotaxis protein
MGERNMRPTILIIDDDPELCDVLAELLEDHGYHAIACRDGIDALAQLRAGTRPLAILLDLQMPRMNGYEFRAAQLADPDLAGIPVLLISDQRTIDRARLGIVELVPRPFSAARLLSAIDQLASASRNDQDLNARRTRRALP